MPVSGGVVGGDLRSLMRKLLLHYREYFSKDGSLNSDGRRILNEFLRILLRQYPEHRSLVRSVRKDPTLENILKLAYIVMDSDEVSDALHLAIYYSPD